MLVPFLCEISKSSWGLSFSLFFFSSFFFLSFFLPFSLHLFPKSCSFKAIGNLRSTQSLIPERKWLKIKFGIDCLVYRLELKEQSVKSTGCKWIEPCTLLPFLFFLKMRSSFQTLDHRQSALGRRTVMKPTLYKDILRRINLLKKAVLFPNDVSSSLKFQKYIVHKIIHHSKLMKGQVHVYRYL